MAYIPTSFHQSQSDDHHKHSPTLIIGHKSGNNNNRLLRYKKNQIFAQTSINQSINHHQVEKNDPMSIFLFVC